jgi:hypothetical protein
VFVSCVSAFHTASLHLFFTFFRLGTGISYGTDAFFCFFLFAKNRSPSLPLVLSPSFSLELGS